MFERMSTPRQIVQAVADRLTQPDLASIIDLVAYPEPGAGGPGIAIVVANHEGSVLLRPSPGPGDAEQHTVLAGHDPVARTDPLAFLPYQLELADPSPSSRLNSYPDPARRLASFFADPERSPDLVIVHTPRHYFPGQGGHRGEHGSLDVIQSRAPFVLSGAGVTRRGLIHGSARTIDIGPTLLHLAGVPASAQLDALGKPLDGRARTDLVQPGARFVIGLLWDGAHCSDLLQLAQDGQLPHVASLLEQGMALIGGAVAEFPSVTLCNHTCALTGLGPGRHGILGNVFYDRKLAQTVLANDESTWHRSAEWLRPPVRTVFEILAAERPGARTGCVNEPIDRGASYSTMQLIRERRSEHHEAGGADELQHLLPAAEQSPFLTDPEHLADGYYRWCTRVDDAGLAQMLQLWPDAAHAPALTWWNNCITDAGHHAGGPRSVIARASLIEADRRLGVLLGHLRGLGVLDDVAFLLTADHGFEAADVMITGSWAPALAQVCAELGVSYRDEGPGLVYLGV